MIKKIVHNGICFLFLWGCLNHLSGQSTPASKLISVNYRNISLKEVLSDLSQKTGCQFSYSPNKIPVDAKISINLENITLQNALPKLLTNLPVDFEFVDSYVVLKKGKEPMSTQAMTGLQENKQVTLSGFIKDLSTGEFLPGATILISKLNLGAITNGYGFFSMTLPSGKYMLELSFLGFDRLTEEVELTSNCKFDFTLHPQTQKIEEVVISNLDKADLRFKRHASQTDLQPQTIAKLPSLMGEPDVLKSLGTIPGINFSGDGSGYFHVRGGNDDQNLVLLDEANLFNPSHLLGIFSPLIPDAIQSVDIYKADYPVNFGGRLSSVIDIRTKDGNKNKLAFSGDIGLISSRATLEGPIKKDASSFFVSFRKSYFDAYLKPLVPTLQAFYFYDFTTKFNFKLGRKDRLFVTVYKGNDQLRSSQNTPDSNGLNWGNTSMTLRWNHIFGPRLFLNSTFLASAYEYYLYTSVINQSFWNSKVANQSLKEELTWFVSPRLTWKFGVKWAGYGFNPGNFQTASTPLSNQVSPVNSLETVFYAGAEQVLHPRFKLNYGLRWTSWANRGEAFVVSYDANYNPTGVKTYAKNEIYYRHSAPEPRISGSFRISKNVVTKLSYSHSLQYLNLLNNSISPFSSLEVWLPSGPNIKPRSADMVDLGINFSPGGLEIQSDVYYKWLHQQIGYAYHASMLINPVIEGQIRQGEGFSYGWETSLEKKAGRFTGRLGYTYSRVIEKINGLNGNNSFPASFDRPHNFVAELSWQLTPRWLLTFNYNMSSGMRYTSPTSFYNYRGYQVPVYTSQNNDHLPAYKRLDVSTSFQLNKPNRKFQHSLQLSVINILNHQNPIFVYYNKMKSNAGKYEIPMDRLNSSQLVSSMRFLYGPVPSLSYHFNF